MNKTAVTARQMRKLDEEAINDFNIPSIVLMENAGRAVYEEALSMLSKIPEDGRKKVLCVCGKGNNGGDGLVAARYLANEGFGVSVYMLCEEKRLKKDPLTNFNMLRKLGVGISCVKSGVSDFSKYDLIIDSIFGTGFNGSADKFTSVLIEKINESGVPVLSVDVPSGLDATAGTCRSGCIRAARTVSFGLAKSGFYRAEGPEATGEVVVRNIGFPASLLKKFQN